MECKFQTTTRQARRPVDATATISAFSGFSDGSRLTRFLSDNRDQAPLQQVVIDILGREFGLDSRDLHHLTSGRHTQRGYCIREDFPMPNC